MNLDEARDLLNLCVRSELRDHAFGDTEIYWTIDDNTVAEAYFGGRCGDANNTVEIIQIPDESIVFSGKDAEELRSCGTPDKIERNDTTGPDTYSQGITMPGLTLEGVLRELTGE